MSAIEEAIDMLRHGKFVLVHDDKGREDEIDMVMAAEYITPKNIATMRNDAGGLLCLAISNEITTKLGLAYMHDIIQSLSSINPVFSKLTYGKSPYGDKPSFSIAINHRDTYTGITDIDRALTISKMAEICKKIDSGGVEEFAKNFRTPGHVPILIASKGLLEERRGHTELCVYLAQMSKLAPAVVICEMLDSITHRALSINKAKEYADIKGITLLEASQLKTHAKAA
ncbi:MAG TPA: 3,4-dihydroxy-2-butanone-4-phosphate synthase [Nitrososphaeraceae archaeon]|nr:3,4-dihydroxy-2-butanone-4-phosphate synthase [Nitrososphaeraceae archaeon]